MPSASESKGASARSTRSDAVRNRQVLLDAAAEVFVASGVDAPIREIAARAGVGTGTVYRHFPTRADLVVAVYRHQVEACAEAGPALLADSASPFAALRAWTGLFVDFLVTKHGLADAMRADSGGFEALHAYFLDRLVPVCAQLLDAAADSRRDRARHAGVRADARHRQPLRRVRRRPPLRPAPPGRAAPSGAAAGRVALAPGPSALPDFLRAS